MAGALVSRHPAYEEYSPDWRQLRDTYRGERVVKSRGVLYLPPTSGMEADGAKPGTATGGVGTASVAQTKGWKVWSAYRRRAVFPEVVREAVEAMLGVMHHQPPKIELPAALEPLRERATSRNESLEALLRRINEEQLVTGRVGMLLDVPERPTLGLVLPYVALYQSEHVVNWDDGGDSASDLENLNLVVLDESGDQRVGTFEWERVERYRVLVLGDPIQNEDQGQGAPYRSGVFKEGEQFSEEALATPSIAGRTLDRIPFVFANTKDVVASPDDAPLIGLSNLSLTIYRGEADYRQALFMQGQDTLVRIGATSTEGEEIRVGAGASIDLPIGGEAYYIGVKSEGLPEMREALVNDYARAEKKAVALLEAVSQGAESGEALRVRVASRTASLNQIALTGAFALQELLRLAATWVGANPEEVVVTPNLDFVGEVLASTELVGYMTAKGLGAPLSLRSIHELEQKKGITTRTFEEEQAEIAKEEDAGLPGSTVPAAEPGSTSDDGPQGDEGDEEGDDEDGEPKPKGKPQAKPAE